MDLVCLQRQRDGFPGISIQWGALGTVGALEGRFKTGVPGVDFLPIKTGVENLDALLMRDEPIITCWKMARKCTQHRQTSSVLRRICDLLG